MLRSLFVVAAFLAATGQAQAAWLTQYATMDRGTSGSVANVQLITGSKSAGMTFTNTISHTTGGFMNGDTRRIVTVGANLLTDASFIRDLTPYTVPAIYDGQPIVAVYALEGTATTFDGPGNASALFDTGRVAFFTTPTTADFNRFDPTTWGAVSGGSLNDPIAVFDLANPANVAAGTVDGPPDPDSTFNLTSDQVNVSTIRTDNATRQGGDFLFLESQTYLGNTRAGNDFLTVTGPDFGPGAIEGLVINADQEVVGSPLSGGGINLAQLDVLNTIAVELGDLGGNAAGGFATGFASGPGGTVLATDYNLTDNPAATGDLRAAVGLTMAPVAVPEPASIAVFSLMGVCALPIIRRQRRKQAAA